MQNKITSKSKIELSKKELPKAIDIEEIVLGAMLIDNKNRDIAFELLNKECFHDKAHKDIFGVMQQLNANQSGIDLPIVTRKIIDQNIDVDIKYLAQLTLKISSSTHLEYHCRILQQKHIKRGIIQHCVDTLNEANKGETDIFDLLNNAFNGLNLISDFIVPNKSNDNNEIFESLMDRGDKLKRGEITPGLETPIKRINEILGGWRKSELIILAARPSVGKTAFAIKAAWHLVKQNIDIAFFSFEMSADTLISRILSIETELNNNKYQNDGLTRSEQTQNRSVWNKYNTEKLHIEDKAQTLDINTLTLRAKKLKKEHNIQIVFVDYLQLMKGVDTGNKPNREQEISGISRGLKTLAQTLDIPVVALSQLNRKPESRGDDKSPQLSDLRESGAIEQDADVVCFFNRPEIYGITEWQDYDNANTTNEAEFSIFKNRNGGLGRDRMKFVKHLTDFRDIDDPKNDEDDLIIPTNDNNTLYRKDYNEPF